MSDPLPRTNGAQHIRVRKSHSQPDYGTMPIMTKVTVQTEGLPSSPQQAKAVAASVQDRSRSLTDPSYLNELPVHSPPHCIVQDTICTPFLDTPQAFRQSPAKAMAKDFAFLIKNIGLVPSIILPINRSPIDRHIRSKGILSGLFQVSLISTSLVLTAGVVTSFFTSIPPMAVWVPIVTGFCWVSLWLQGGRVKESDRAVDFVEGHEKEEWIYINGIATDGWTAEATVDYLQDLFHRPITGVLNKTLGMWFDLIECILQRDLFWSTQDIRSGYEIVRTAMMDPTKERIVIIAHSQGGIICSAWVDQLLCDFPADTLAKLEIYTFASAANHLSRPLYLAKTAEIADAKAMLSNCSKMSWDEVKTCIPAAFQDPIHIDGAGNGTSTHGGNSPAVSTTLRADQVGLRALKATQPFHRVEHFANENDFVARFGVLGWSPEMPKEQYLGPNDRIPLEKGDFGGRVFMRPKTSGHMLIAHYLHPSYSILDDPVVRAHSRLVTYLGGGGSLATPKVLSGSPVANTPSSISETTASTFAKSQFTIRQRELQKNGSKQSLEEETSTEVSEDAL